MVWHSTFYTRNKTSHYLKKDRVLMSDAVLQRFGIHQFMVLFVCEGILQKVAFYRRNYLKKFPQMWRRCPRKIHVTVQRDNQKISPGTLRPFDLRKAHKTFLLFLQDLLLIEQKVLQGIQFLARLGKISQEYPCVQILARKILQKSNSPFEVIYPHFWFAAKMCDFGGKT